jgi:hypothetical protein
MNKMSLKSVAFNKKSSNMEFSTTSVAPSVILEDKDYSLKVSINGRLDAVVWAAYLLLDLLLLNHMCNPETNRLVRPKQNREVLCARNGAHLRIGLNGHGQIGKG